MLLHFSWSQFFLFIGSALALYYLTVGLLCYRREIQRLLHRLLALSPLSRQPASPPLPEIMGAVAPAPAPVVLTDTEDLLVSAQAGDKLAAFEPDTVADLLQELTSLLETGNTAMATKEDFLLLVQLVIAKYSAALPAQLQDHVNRFLLEQTRGRFPFELQAADLQALWSGTPA